LQQTEAFNSFLHSKEVIAGFFCEEEIFCLHCTKRI